MVNPGPVYDLDVLKRGLLSVEANIEAISKGLEAERVKKADYEKHIAAAEAILQLHGQGHE